MKLTVKNFGPIREAEEIEIAPMTVLVGHSNTGKSYLAMLAYATISVLTSSGIAWAIRNPATPAGKGVPFWEAWQSKEGGIEFIESLFMKWTEHLSYTWNEEARRCFGHEDWKSLIKGKRFSVVVSHSDDLQIDLINPKNSELKLGKITDNIYKRVRRYIAAVIDVPVQEAGKVADIQYEMHQWEILSILSSELVKQCVQVLLYDVYKPDRLMTKHDLPYFFGQSFHDVESPASVHYLPAIRGGIMQSHRTLVGALIRGATRGGIKQATESIPLFNGVLADFMENVIDLGDAERRLPENDATAKVGKYMEESILFGEIKIEKSESGYPDFRYRFGSRENPVNLSLMSASSSVSELAPIVLFIRHYLKKGDFFIVEEPEAHLHPKAQLLIADVLTQLVNAGVYVMVTTHSDVVLEELGNFVLHAKLNDKSETNLKEEDCSVCLFRRPTGKVKSTKVESVNFDPDSGFVTQDHLDESTKLYNKTAALLDRLDAKSND